MTIHIYPLLLVGLATIYSEAHAQNTFPSSGNVGVGTTSPTSSLHIVGTNAFLTLQNTDGTGGTGLRFAGNGSDAYVGQSAGLNGFTNGAVSGDLNIRTNSRAILFSTDDGNTPAMNISGGKVGIGSGFFCQSTSDYAVLNRNAYLLAGSWQLPDPSQGSATIVLRNNSVVQMYATATPGTLDWREMFSFDAVGNRAWFPNGNVGIGTTVPSERLSVNGNIRAKKVIVTQSGWADYVFGPGYVLRPLNELEHYLEVNHHLPDVPSAKEIQENGNDLGETQKAILKKVEELTLYVIALEKQNKEFKRDIEILKSQKK